jgi:Mg-chelatase subunit ChlD
VIDEARRRTTGRRELSSTPGFAEVSPDVGVLDEAAFDELLGADPDAALSLLAELTGATDAGLRRRALELAARLMIELARDRPPDAAGIGQFVSRRFRAPGDDIDVDRSLDALVESRRAARPVRPDELAARGWARRSTAWCLLVDRSGSMHGRPLATAALAAAALALRADRDEFAVLSFARDVVAPKAMWEQRPVDDVVDRVLALRGHGTTDVAGALTAAGEQLRASSAGRRVTVVLSDCRATEPGDVVAAARALDEVVILAPAGDDADARRLADAVGARCATYDGPSSIVDAIASVLDRR